MAALVIFMCIQLGAQGTEDGYTNPVVRGYSPDPSICRVDKDYYMVTGTNLSFPDIPVWHSLDLVHWKRIGYCMTRQEQFFLEAELDAREATRNLS